MGPNRNQPDEENQLSDPRGFNNPNLKITIKFKNKVKNSIFEFFVNIEPEHNSFDVEESKEEPVEFKVKRSLYEFQDLFNHLKASSPDDAKLEALDFNRMF